MTIAVTAVSGQLGAEIARTLLERGEAVIGLARTPEKVTGLGIEIRPGDYADRAGLEASLKGVGRLLLVSGNGDPAARIDQHRNVIAAARAAGAARIVYTSVQGAETGMAFSPVVDSNRRTEADIRAGGMDWVIGRNGIYIEPDVDYVDRYREAGEIANSAGEGRCGYTTRGELAAAYAHMLTEPQHVGHTYNLRGAPITQAELAGYINRAFGTALTYRTMSVEEYRADRVAELGAFMGTVIAGIYEGIRNGAVDNPGHFEQAAGRAHIGWSAFFDGLQR
ncbi:NAD(P)H-binding protein [Tropicimonas sediminicola]|uniref:NAD(P)H dehydrogenase (Quinone) n=1 Tax=Tropicimonas sediminicola TaxID=1031541 RepID=A0A239LMH3_9RHOB|nr:NAD(P)H-binding protein [Tropicimonas sediminicola]SNT31068.1 NAD(P)H dehydrogenase (quinone) [Tropicimonas sediminicola]